MNLKTITALAVVALLAGAAVFVMMPDDEISIAYSEKVNYETIIVANEKGWLSEEGISGKVVVGGIEAAEALLTGSVQFAAMGDGPAVTLAAKNSHVKILARFIDGENAHRFIANRSLIPNIESIAGEGLGQGDNPLKVGVQGSSSTHAALLNWMSKNGITPGVDLQIVTMKPTELPLAVKAGELAMMAGSEPWAVNTENECGDDVYEIGTSAGLESTYPILLLTTDRVIERHPDAVRGVLRAMDRANQFINDDWGEAMEICSSRTGLSMEDQIRCSDPQRYELGFEDSDILSFNIAAKAMLLFGSIEALPVVDDHVELSFLREILA